MAKIKVLGSKGCGSAIAEAFLILAQIPYEQVELDYDQPGPLRDELRARNPLGQVPTLILEDGMVLTETLAVAHYAQDRNSKALLIPISAQDRVRFFRWSTFIISSIYPCFTYGDDPKKWIGEGAQTQALRTATTEQLKKLWLLMESEAGAPYFLGDTFSALDIYIKVMTHWRPGMEWMRGHVPKLLAIRERIENKEELKELWAYHFD